MILDFTLQGNKYYARLWIRITYFIPSRFIHACEFIALFWLMWSKMTKS